MGVNDLLGQVPGGKMEESQHGFQRLTLLLNKNQRVDLDTGTLVYLCALIHKEAYNAGN